MSKPALPERIQAIDPYLLHGIIVSPLMTPEEQMELLDQIPSGLTMEEINSLGMLAFNGAKSSEHSEGMTNGAHRERQALSNLARLVLVHDKDIITAKNAADHLRSRPGVLNRLEARRIERRLKGAVRKETLD